MKVVWLPAAKRDRSEIVNFFAADNPRAAVRMDELFMEAVARLGKFPKLGRPGAIAGTRELIPHKSYRIVYEVDGGTVWILALIHTARLWPPPANESGA